jgi:transglutaminase-like putative cysteine protease
MGVTALLTLVRELNTQIYEAFDYQQHVTKADLPIDVALSERRGVCLDFAHIMLALTRQVDIPSRMSSVTYITKPKPTTIWTPTPRKHGFSIGCREAYSTARQTGRQHVGSAR